MLVGGCVSQLSRVLINKWSLPATLIVNIKISVTDSQCPGPNIFATEMLDKNISARLSPTANLADKHQKPPFAGRAKKYL